MRTKFTCLALAALFALAAFGPTSASAATEFGDNCVANASTVESPVTLFGFGAPGNPLPATAPTAGILTKWKINSAIGTAFPHALKVLRPNGFKTVLIVGEATGNVNAGTNTFDARIPVAVGDRLAIFGSSAAGTVACGVPGETAFIGGFLGAGGSTGSTVPVVEEPAEVRIPVTGIIEPDVDNDGFGDETQDLCPQLAALQTACPVVTLNATAKPRKGSVSVLVTASSQAPVTVTGTVKLGKGKTAKLNGGAQVVLPGAIARFTLFLPKAVRDRLKALSRKASLKLSVLASATDLVGRVSTDTVNVKLRGQKKPPRKAKPKGR
ncbi:MAG TPA: hypothetical protein VF729_04940 [Solirubrobacterales bacterium]